MWLVISMGSLDLLLINPTLDYKEDEKYYEKIKIEKDIPRLQPPHIGIGYLMGASKKAGLNAEYVDMVQQGVSSDGLLDYVSKTRPTLVGFTTWTTRINAAGYLAREIKDKYSVRWFVRAVLMQMLFLNRH